MSLINIYCDESCHLLTPTPEPMVLGGIWCDSEKSKEVSQRIRDYKKKHGYTAEFKWTKISPANREFYLELVDYFFDDNDLHFRGIIVPDKSILDHQKFQQTHDEWYYKMYFDMLKIIFEKGHSYRVLLDIKDTNSAEQNRKLHLYLCNKLHDFDAKVVVDVQAARSHLINILQLTDIFTGALSYLYRHLTTSRSKEDIIRRIRYRSGLTLNKTTLTSESKFNLLVWNPKEGRS